MAQVYVWGKYNLNVKYEEDHSAHAPKQGDINNFWVGKSYSFSAVNGKYTLNNALEMSRENDAAQYPYAIDGFFGFRAGETSRGNLVFFDA